MKSRLSPKILLLLCTFLAAFLATAGLTVNQGLFGHGSSVLLST